MPYIAPHRRDLLTPSADVRPATAGELNFQLTKLATAYLEHHGLSYDVLNDIVGAFEGAKAEFQRRVVEPYEDKKRAENGDVY